ncbi:hypothetical protein SEA_PHARAOH_37 [Mycobacterium phage Pharaoh]|uniref:Uncharacterized protein n=1 Tax=Mycobacterium phage Pharaoh TaxID=2530140 RepID=A0A481W234_9CAUD|nr:hypothetical protein KIV59_gp53 [Mycobacterium phage Pharaoh]QBJ00226.1 hypothetical protein SEA_PHARAOH_37 [Mycobacterium phage Pharaoh]
MKIKLELTDTEGEEYFADATIEGAELLPPDTMLHIAELTVVEMWKAVKSEMQEAMV